MYPDILNVFGYFFTADRFRPHLFTLVDGYNDFINAVFLPVSTHIHLLCDVEVNLLSWYLQYSKFGFKYQGPVVRN